MFPIGKFAEFNKMTRWLTEDILKEVDRIYRLEIAKDLVKILAESAMVATPGLLHSPRTYAIIGLTYFLNKSFDYNTKLKRRKRI
jgi:hypothetical protein